MPYYHHHPHLNLKMAGNSSLRLLILGLSLLSFSFQCFCHCNVNKKGETSSAGIKGMFVFGSSLVDNGNNNFLPNSLARADYLPYGIDFPLGASGRFTNGKNVIDLLGEQLKIPSLIPVFADPQTKGSKIVHGVNFASGASGILDDTGSLAVTIPTSLIDFIFLHIRSSSEYMLLCFIAFHQ